MTTLNKEHSELRERLFKRLKTDDKADTYVIPFRVMDVLVDEIIDLIQTSNKEARIDEINLFREAMINHSTPMIYAPDRIKQLKQEEAK